MLLYSSILNMEAILSSEAADDFQLTTWYCMLEDKTVQKHNYKTSNPIFIKYFNLYFTQNSCGDKFIC
jgi:hypothetical protein